MQKLNIIILLHGVVPAAVVINKLLIGRQLAIVSSQVGEDIAPEHLARVFLKVAAQRVAKADDFGLQMLDVP
jgi:hypothetical protein